MRPSVVIASLALSVAALGATAWTLERHEAPSSRDSQRAWGEGVSSTGFSGEMVAIPGGNLPDRR
jgi:hypothetical protein